MSQIETSIWGPKRVQKTHEKKGRPTEAKTRRGNRVYRNRFRHKGEVRYADDYTFLIKKEGERHRLNLGSNLEDAKRMADQISAFMMVPSNTFLDLFEHPDFKELRMPKRYRRIIHGRSIENGFPVGSDSIFVPTIGEILRIYEENTPELSRHTVINNCNALRYITAGILGLRKLTNREKKAKRVAWRKKVDAVPINELTRAALLGFRNHALRQAGSDQEAIGKTMTTLNSYFRSARSVFTEEMVEHYEGFILPDPLPFQKIRPFREPSRQYESMDDAWEIVKAAKKRFWDKAGSEFTEKKADSRKGGRPSKTREDVVAEDKSRFIILLLTISCGLRPKEISRLTWNQIDFDKRIIRVRRTSYDTPKTRSSEASVGVSQIVLEYLEELREYSRLPPFVIPTVTLGHREPLKRGVGIFKELCQWLRKNGVDCMNPLYVFRKEAGSMIYDQTDSYDLAADFLRNDPRIAREHYVSRKKGLEIEVPQL